MRTTLLRLALVTVLSAGYLLGASALAQAASPQIDGTADFRPSPTIPCDESPSPPYDDLYPALVMQGSLVGCWYTNILDSRETNGGVYLERGEELFVGTLNGGDVGTFRTTYRFEAKLAADGSEIRGRCQHPIVAGSGTGGFEGATGRLDFKDIIGNPITYVYRGHIRLP